MPKNPLKHLIKDFESSDCIWKIWVSSSAFKMSSIQFTAAISRTGGRLTFSNTQPMTAGGSKQIQLDYSFCKLRSLYDQVTKIRDLGMTLNPPLDRVRDGSWGAFAHMAKDSPPIQKHWRLGSPNSATIQIREMLALIHDLIQSELQVNYLLHTDAASRRR